MTEQQTDDEIAVEAWRKIVKRQSEDDQGIGLRITFEADCIRIILSAIKKATRAQADEAENWKAVALGNKRMAEGLLNTACEALAKINK